MLEILNSGQFASPIIVFVNQKKTADMVAKDLQRAGVRTNTSLIFASAHANLLAVECRYSPFRQEPGAARSRFAVTTDWRRGYSRGYGSRWSWYRCARRYVGYQLPDVQHHRGVCSSYRYVLRSAVTSNEKKTNYSILQVVLVVLASKAQQSRSSPTTMTKSCTYLYTMVMPVMLT